MFILNMNSLLLSKITKYFLNPDSATLLHDFKPQSQSSEGVELSKQSAPQPASVRPACYFFKGALENKTPTPIAYLLTETNETSLARPVPGNSLLLRSLCKGKGMLRQNQQEFVYLDVDDRFISMLFPYLKAYGLVRPSSIMAHVPVIPAREAAFQYLEQIDEIGQEFSFEIEGLYSLTPTSWPEVEQVWFFNLRSESLEKLRRKYFLPKIPGGHPFHIAVAIKSHICLPPLPLMRINMAFIAA